MRDIDLFNAARHAGLTPTRAARYVHHVHQYETTGRTPLPPTEAATAPTS